MRRLPLALTVLAGGLARLARLARLTRLTRLTCLTCLTCLTSLAPAAASKTASAAASASPSPLQFSRCRELAQFECATLAVPLDRSGAIPGTIDIAIARRLSAATPSASAVVALAGGPGQPALPLAPYFAQAVAPALRTRDLIVFDQRGTGESDPLTCPVLAPGGAVGIHTLGGLVRRCGEQVGPARTGYSTAESVQDIEAIRQAAGYEKLVLYGTSYGTKVALQYAETYPSHVEALLLDSTLPPEGEHPFNVASFEAVKRVLAELCEKRACATISHRPLREFDRLAKRLRAAPLHGTIYNGAGRREHATLTEGGLFEILLAGDLNPALRAMMPAAVQAALHSDGAALLRLKLLSEGLVPSLPRRSPPQQSAEEVNTALLIDTTCEDTAYPWNRRSPPAVRLSEAERALRAIPAGQLRPFDTETALGDGLTAGCADWPYTTARTPVNGPLPDVPTLILSGAADLRTPTSNAREVQRMIRGSQLLVVPHTGHSVLGSDFSGCAKAAVEAFFQGSSVLRCAPTQNLFSPTPKIPDSLREVSEVRGLRGRPGRTLMAVLQTMVDLDRQVIGATLQADASLPSGSSFGGLRSGYAKITRRAVRLHDFSFVSGVALSGVFPVRRGRLGPATIDVGGYAAARGDVRLANGRATGALGGHHFDLQIAHAKIASAPSGGQWPSLSLEELPHPTLPRLSPLSRLP